MERYFKKMQKKVCIKPLLFWQSVSSSCSHNGETEKSSSENGQGFGPLIQPLSCFRGLQGIFSLPLFKTDS